MDKDKKKTLTISSNLKKKIDTSSISTSGKKSFSVEKKNPSKAIKHLIKFLRLKLTLTPKLKKKISQENSLNNKLLKNL